MLWEHIPCRTICGLPINQSLGLLVGHFGQNEEKKIYALAIRSCVSADRKLDEWADPDRESRNTVNFAIHILIY